MSILYYHKCDDCLSPFSSTERHIDECDCAGRVTFMGQIQGDKYVKTENRPPCDGRCTHAHGPHCDCSCGGINHGSGRLVQTIVKEGKVKVINPSDDIADDMKRGYKYRELKNYARKMCNDDVNTLDYKVAYRMTRELDKIIGMRVYDPRLLALIAFIGKYRKR